MPDFLGWFCRRVGRAPVLVIHARNESVHALSQGRLLASQIPDAEFKVVDGINHIPLPQDSYPSDMMAATLDFLERHN